MELSKTGMQLAEMLIKIDNNKSFIMGVMGSVPTDKAWKRIIDFIQISAERGDNVSTDDLLAFSYLLKKQLRY